MARAVARKLLGQVLRLLLLGAVLCVAYVALTWRNVDALMTLLVVCGVIVALVGGVARAHPTRLERWKVYVGWGIAIVGAAISIASWRAQGLRQGRVLPTAAVAAVRFEGSERLALAVRRASDERETRALQQEIVTALSLWQPVGLGAADPLGVAETSAKGLVGITWRYTRPPALEDVPAVVGRSKEQYEATLVDRRRGAEAICELLRLLGEDYDFQLIRESPADTFLGEMIVGDMSSRYRISPEKAKPCPAPDFR